MISAQPGGEKSSPNIPHHRDQLPPSDDASLRMTPSFFDGKRDGCLESDQNQVKSTDHTRGDAEVSADPVSVFTAGDAGRECNYCDTQTKK